MSDRIDSYEALQLIAKAHSGARKQHVAAYRVFQESLYLNYKGGLFKADATTILFAKALQETLFSNSTVVPDVNDNPIQITDLNDFITELGFTFNEAVKQYEATVNPAS